MSFLTRSFFKLLNKDSATALCQQFPFRLMLGSRRFVRQKRRHASLPYCVPWSECDVRWLPIARSRTQYHFRDLPDHDDALPFQARRGVQRLAAKRPLAT